MEELIIMRKAYLDKLEELNYLDHIDEKVRVSKIVDKLTELISLI